MTQSEGERRRHSRFAVRASLTCKVKVQGYQSMLPAPGKLRNLSTSGALLELTQRVPPGAMITLSFDAPTGLIQVECEVVWATAGAPGTGGTSCMHGLRFAPSPGGPDPVIADLLRFYGAADTVPGVGEVEG